MLNHSAAFRAAREGSVEADAAAAAAAAVAQQHLALERALLRQREREENENARLRCPHAFNCSGRGDCLFGECHCRSGFSGSSCQTVDVSCPGKCSGHGRCDPVRGCQCALGYAGEDCGRSACALETDASFGGCNVPYHRRAPPAAAYWSRVPQTNSFGFATSA